MRPAPLLLAATLLAAGCAGPVPPDPGPVTSTAPVAAATAGPMVGVTVDATSLLQSVAAGFEAGTSWHTDVDRRLIQVSTTASMDTVVGDAGRFDSTASGNWGGVPFEQLVAGDGVYLKGLDTRYSRGLTWAQFDRPASADHADLVAFAPADPRLLVPTFAGRVATVVEQHDGQTRYQVTGVKLLDIDEATFEVTVDGASRPVRMTIDVPGQYLHAVYTRWGEPVTVTAPPADQVGRPSA